MKVQRADYVYRNVQEALYYEAGMLLKEGLQTDSRNGKTLEDLGHVVTLEKPLERFFLLEHRNDNPFAKLAETLWVLAGRNDIEWLGYYLPRAKDYSDDGLLWRAGYGPRLRKWSHPFLPPVDQLAKVSSLLKADPNSRRAVISLWDPERDWIENTKDAPCNNWIQFIQRESTLDMHITVRSTDLWWGFSGINTFEWSVLHEFVAHNIGANVGEATYFIGSLHLYERHWPQATKMVGAAYPADLYKNTYRPPLEVEIDRLDGSLSSFFYIEGQLRQGVAVTDHYIEDSMSDPFLRSALHMLHAYIQYKRTNDRTEGMLVLDAMPSSDMRTVGSAWMDRQQGAPSRRETEKREDTEWEQHVHDVMWPDADPSAPTAMTTEQEYSDPHDQPPEPKYAASVQPAEPVKPTTWADISDLLVALHTPKDLAYGDSWRKRGELVSIFGNIARKYDRLQNAWNGIVMPSEETQLDTIADLAVYSVKWLMYVEDTNAGRRAGLLEFTRFDDRIRRLPQPRIHETIGQCMQGVQDNFAALEHIMLPRADHAIPTDAEDKDKDKDSVMVKFKWAAICNLARSAMQMLYLYAQQQPSVFGAFELGVLAL